MFNFSFNYNYNCLETFNTNGLWNECRKYAKQFRCINRLSKITNDIREILYYSDDNEWESQQNYDDETIIQRLF